MAQRFNNINNYNEAIANESNNIGQKLFAYIAKGENINDRIRDKFKKSLIFIGDEGQIYNPLTNTYIGIGQTAYIATISYIEDAHDKIKSLNQMLASSMVSAIYANWSQDEWESENVVNPLLGDNKINAMPSKIYATNEIILKGHGDYDPLTKLAATREYSHITDANALTGDTRTLYDHSYKKVSPQNAFATSGITVNLEKGINRYLFAYTFTHKPTGDDANPNDISQLFNYVGQDASTEEFSKTVNFYLTKDEFATHVTYAIDPGNTPLNLTLNDFELVGSLSNKTLFSNFWKGVQGVYEDGVTVPTLPYGDNSSDIINTVNTYLNGQLFKQAPNTLTIDDKLTWSYIASAYTYTLGFAKEYTDNQVNKIYRELLGEQSALIPATEAQALVMIPNKNAEINEDKYAWDETTSTWSYATDSTYESSTNLSTFILSYSSTFVTRHKISDDYTEDINAFERKNGVQIKDGGTATVYPWNALEELAACIMTSKTEAMKNWETYTDNYPGTNVSQSTYVMTKVNEALKDFKYKKWKNNAFEETATGIIAGVSDADTADENRFNNLTNVFFMGYDKTLISNDEEIVTIIAHGTEYLDGDYSNIEGLKVTLIDDPNNNNYKKYETLNDTDNDIQITTRYSSDIYSSPYIYRPVVSVTQNDEGKLCLNGSDNVYDEKTNPLFVVNTSFVSMDDINLVDGIQTLKEVAYVLDMITDGWGNRYEDAEGNGILLTYTIAQNHERIEDHERRLNELEGGRNVVRSIYKDSYNMDKYVNLQISSDTSWISTFDKATTDLITDLTIPSNYLNKTLYCVLGNSGNYVFKSVPQSYIYAYSVIISNYVSHSALHSDSPSHEGFDCPTFTSLFGTEYDGLAGFIEYYDNDDAEETRSYFVDTNGNIVDSIPSYTGQVGLGINVNIAPTFESYLYCGPNDGYEIVDLNSSFVNKTGVCYLTVSYNINYKENITYFTEPISNAEYGTIPCVNNEHLRFSDDDITDLDGKEYSTYKDTLLAQYKEEIDNYLSNFGLTNCTLSVKGENREYTGINMQLWLNITGIDNTIKEGYNEDIYDSSYTKCDPIDICVDDLGENVYYIRKSSVKQKTIDTNSDGLTNVEWVTTYVSQVVDNVTRSIRGVEFEAYQYSRNLISQLDTSFVSSYGMYLAGIEQKDGKVSPIVRELPKDNITALTTFWGENTENSKNYTAVLSSDIEDEIAMDTPLFIQSGVEYYEVPTSTEYLENIVDSVIQLKLDESSSYSYVYMLNDESEYVKVNTVYEEVCLSSVKVGPEFRNFKQFYFARPAYQRIDGADLRKNGDNWKINVNEVDYSTSTTEENLKIYKLNTTKPDEVKQYISAKVDYQSDYTDGVGGNNFKVTAHITKLSDASENNSGLVDAYDVRNTLDSMFEWVDLSRWDASSDEVNPINTEEHEDGGNVTAATRINDTKVTNASQDKSNSLGYPIDLSTTE